MSDASASWTTSRNTLIASLRVGDHRGDVCFEASGASLEPSPDALIPLVLPLAMRAGVPVQLPTEISPRLRSAVPSVEALLHGWFPDRFRRVDVQVRPGEERRPASSRTACFFTGGLDSFCEVVRLRGHLDDLIYVQGFDVPPGDDARARDAKRAIRTAAAELDLPLVKVDTDLRAFSDSFLTWEEYHGAALSAVALMLGRHYSRVLIASSHGALDLSPWGSHPVLDPLWSTDRVEIVHSGYGLTRIDKAWIASTNDVALRWMRVCYLPPEGTINCGVCEKCLRTAVNLRAVGALERCQTLPHEIRPEQLSSLELDPGSQARWQLNLDALRERGDAPELTEAIEAALQRLAGQHAGDGTSSEDRLDRGSRGPASGPTGGRFGIRHVRRLLLRLLGPYIASQGRRDSERVAELAQLRDELEREREARRFLLSELERRELAHHPSVGPPSARRRSISNRYEDT